MNFALSLSACSLALAVYVDKHDMGSADHMGSVDHIALKLNTNTNNMQRQKVVDESSE